MPSPKNNTRAIPRQATSYMTTRTGTAPDACDPLLAFAPVLHARPRRNSITPDRQRAFISHLAATGIVTQAAKHIGASMEALYKLRKKPGSQGFDAAWDAAVDRGVARLEDCALARAIEGETRLVVSAGKVVGSEQRHNESLVMFILRNRRSSRYGADIRAGHPLYERIRAEVRSEILAGIAADQPDEARALASLNAKLDALAPPKLAIAQRNSHKDHSE